MFKPGEALPKRKKNRWSGFDYANCRAYFITVCLKDRSVSLWKRLPPGYLDTQAELVSFSRNHRPWEEGEAVGAAISRPPFCLDEPFFDAGTAHPPLSLYGATIQTAIHALSVHYPQAEVDKYCIMPDHIHLILFLNAPEPEALPPDAGGRLIAAPTEPPPVASVSTMIGHMKRWVSKQCSHSIWQKSFYDRVIRNEREYQACWRYIDENPLKWLENRAD